MKRILLFFTLFLLSIPYLSAQNLLTNGGFEAGANGTGFNVSGAGYTELTAPFSGTTLAGNYALVTNAVPLDATFSAGGDHTSGTGTMLVVNGSTSATGQPLFWQAGNTPAATICGLTVGNKYVFSYWVRSISSQVTNPATQPDIRASITNASAITLLSGTAVVPLPAAGWMNVSYVFTATATCSKIGLWNANVSATGNDFAVDDFSLVPAASVVASTAVVCKDGSQPDITFTANIGVPPYTFTYNINGVLPNTTVPAPGAGNSVVLQVPTGTAGVYNYNLVSFTYGPTPVTNQVQPGTATVTVKALPTAAISPDIAICSGANGTVTFTGTPNAIVTYNDSALGTQTITLNAAGTASMTQPYGSTTTYTLLSVALPGTPDCIQPLTDSMEVLVYPAPTASVSPSGQTICSGGDATVTFTGTPGATITYNAGSGNQTILLDATGTASITQIYTTTTTYNLIKVTSAAPENCVTNLTGSAVVTVAPPTASINGTTTILAGGAATLTFFGTGGATVHFSTQVYSGGGNVIGTGTVVLSANGSASYSIPYLAATTTFCLIDVVSAPTPNGTSCTTTFTPNTICVTVTVNTNTCDVPLAEVSIEVPDPVCNSGDCIELTANFSNIAATTDYIVSPMPYCPSFPFTGGTVIDATGDDSWSPTVNLPFEFSFYGVCYDKILVGTNGVVTFDFVNQTPLGGCNWPYTQSIPNAGFPIRNAIFGVYQDTNIATPPVTNTAVQNVNYYILDTGANVAPNRVFVANFNELPQFSCNNSVGFQTSQIVIHETTNIIEIFVNKRTPCLGWNSGNGLIGIINQGGNLATVPPGRNTGTWSATNEAWRFYPKNIPATPTEIQWFEGTTPIGAINENPITVCPTGPSTYTAVVTYQNCGITTIDDTVNINVVAPFDVHDPVDITLCTAAAPTYTVNIDQINDMLLGVTDAWNYDIRIYEDQVEAEQNGSGYVNPADLPAYTFNGPLPKTFYARIEAYTGSTCYNVRPFTVDIGAPSGTIIYPATPYCKDLTTPQPITEIALTSGGTYSAVSIPAGLHLEINPTTGAVTPNLSDVGVYTVSYTIPAAPPCPAYTTSTSVEIKLCGCAVTTSLDPATSMTICRNAVLPPITYSTPVVATAGSVTGTLPPGTTGAFAGGIYTVSGTPNTAGTYTYIVSLTSGGNTCTASTTITVTPNVVIALTSAAATTSQTPCIGTAITPITYSITNGATGASVSGLPNGVTGNFTAGTPALFTISGTPTSAGPNTYTVTTSGGCGTVTSGGTINVTPAATLVLTSATGTAAQTPCINTAITNIVYTFGGSATGATVSTLPTGVIATVSGSTIIISGSPSVAGPFPYTVTTTGPCAAVLLTGTITVSPASTLVLASATGTNAQTPCVGTAITNISYTIGGSATGATVTGLPSGVSSTVTGNTVTISGIPTGAGPNTYTVTTTGPCAAVTATGTINVTPIATLALTSAAGTDAQSPCINTAITNIVYTFGGSATGATVSTLPTGVIATVSGSTITISGSPSVGGPFPYTVTTTGPCAPVLLTGMITVSPASTLVLASAAGTNAQTPCVGTAITNITYTIGGSATGATVSGLPSGLSSTVTGNTVTISGIPTAAGPNTYTVTTTGPCAAVTATGTINVTPIATLALTSAAGTDAQSPCINTPITNIVYTFGGSATGVTVSPLPTGVSFTVVGNTVTISGSPSVAGPFPFGYTVTTTGPCAAVLLTGTFDVIPAMSLSLTSPAGTDAQTPCINTAITNIEYTLANGATGAGVTGLPGGVTYTVTGNVVEISGAPNVAGPFTYTVTTTGGCAPAAVKTGTINIFQASTIALTSATATTTQTPCINTAITNIVYTIGGSATGATVTGLPSGVIFTVAGNVVTISGTPTVSGPFAYTVTTTGPCASVAAGGTITITEASEISLTSATATSTQTPCINTAITNIVYTIGGSATGATVTGLPGGVSYTVVGDVVTISGTPNVSGPFPYTVETTGPCAPVSLTGTITIFPASTIALTSAAATAAQAPCINTAITNIVYTIGGSATGATVTGLPSGVTFTVAGNVVTISGTPTVSGPFGYTVATTGPCASVSLSGTFDIKPLPTVVLTSALPTTAQTPCINTAITNIVYTIGSGATGATVTGLPTGVTFAVVGNIVTISGSPSVAGPFTYTVTTTGGCSPAATQTGTITVRGLSTLVLTSASANMTVCINEVVSAANQIKYTFGGTATGATVTGLPSGMIFTIVGNVVTISGTPTVAGIAIPYSITTTGGCLPNVTLNGTITINPAATIALTSAAGTAAQTLCLTPPTAITPIRYTIANGATGVNITSGLPPGITTSLAGNVFTISGTPTGAGDFNYIVTTTGGCSSASLSGVIHVLGNVTLTLTSGASSTNQVLCVNTQPISPITYAYANGATGATVTGLPPGLSGSFAGGVFTISGTATSVGTGIWNYTVTTSGGCSTASLSGVVTVSPSSSIALTSAAGTNAQRVCVDQESIVNITYLIGNGATGASVVAGTLPTGVTQDFDAATGILTISGTPLQSGPFPYTVITSGGCAPDATLTGIINVDPLPVVDLQDGFICLDTSGNLDPGANALLDTNLSPGQYSFIWYDAAGVIPAQTGSAYQALVPGTYTVKVTNLATGCYNTASATIITSFPPQFVRADVSAYFSEQQVVTVFVTPAGNYEYQIDGGAWQDSNQFVNLPSGYHDIMVRDKVGCGELPVTIRIIDYPKFFTPNGDGYNDTWNIPDLSDQEASIIYIFDRYGKLLKEMSPKGTGWDGTLNGHLLPSTDYWFKVFFEEQGVSREFKAHFSLKR